MADNRKTKVQLLDELSKLRIENEKLKESERIVRESEERYREFANNIPDGFFEYDLQGNINFCNESLPRIFGYTRKEFMELDRYKRHESREYAKQVFREYAEMYEKNISLKVMEHRILRRDGEILDFESTVSLMRNANGDIIGYRGIGRDITERKKMQRELERYRDFFENVEDLCAEYDLQGNIIFCNESVPRSFGYSRDAFMKLDRYKRHESREYGKYVFSQYTDMQKNNISFKIMEYRIMCKDGSLRDIEGRVSLVRDSKGVVVGFRGIGHDITERKRMGEEQERLREELVQARKMEAIGTLAGGVAHDFNNLLMGIQGYASLIMADMNYDDSHYQQLKAIETLVKSGADLTRQLLAYARGGRYEVKPLNLNDIIKKSSEMFGRTKKEIVIEQDLADDLWTIDADRSQMEQVLLNLFVNAWQAMPGGGKIFIKTANVDMESSQVRSLEILPGPYIRLTIKDTGTGMDAVTLERIFEPFFTTKEMGGIRGTGLGLASVYGIIKGHRGAINVQSEKWKGAIFNIYLPASSKKVLHEIAPENLTLHGHETILLVDDEKAVREVLASLVAGLGYKVIAAGNSEEALSIYRKDPAAIDLIIIDMIMPGLGGGVTIDAIRALNPDARIILSSGYSLDGEAQEILNRGGNINFMQKPFLPAELSQKIRSILDR